MRMHDMTPPEAQGSGKSADAPMRPAVSAFVVPDGISVLKIRADFLRAAQAKRHGAGSFLLQARPRGDASPGIRVGFTASKKIGNAVLRNRAKRRLRAAAQAVLPVAGTRGYDYVLVARAGTLDRPWPQLLDDLRKALEALTPKGRGIP